MPHAPAPPVAPPVEHDTIVRRAVSTFLTLADASTSQAERTTLLLQARELATLSATPIEIPETPEEFEARGLAAIRSAQTAEDAFRQAHAFFAPQWKAGELTADAWHRLATHASAVNRWLVDEALRASLSPLVFGAARNERSAARRTAMGGLWHNPAMPDAERRRLADTLTTRLVAEINRHLDEWAIVEGLAECGALTAGDRLTGDLLDGVRRIAGDARYAFGPRHGAANVMVRLPECTEAELLDATAFVNRVTQAKWQVLLRHPNAGPKVWAAVVRARPDRVAMWVAKQPRMARCAEVREALCSPEVELYVNQAVMLEAQLRDAGDPVVFDDVLGDLIQVDVARAAAVVPSLPARRRGMITQERLAALLAGAPASSRVALITAVGTITPRETTACTPDEEASRRQRPRRRR